METFLWVQPLGSAQGCSHATYLPPQALLQLAQLKLLLEEGQGLIQSLRNLPKKERSIRMVAHLCRDGGGKMGALSKLLLEEA